MFPSRHRRSSSASSNQAYDADSSDIETICEDSDDEEDDPEWSYHADGSSIEEEWWGNVEDEVEEELSATYDGSETDSDSTVVDDSGLPHSPKVSLLQVSISRWYMSCLGSDNVFFNQRLVWKFATSSRSPSFKPSKSLKLSSASKVSLGQAKSLSSPEKRTLRTLWSLS